MKESEFADEVNIHTYENLSENNNEIDNDAASSNQRSVDKSIKHLNAELSNSQILNETNQRKNPNKSRSAINNIKSAMFPEIQSKDYKTQTKETLENMKKFELSLEIGIIFFIINIGLGLYLWISKKSLFGLIFFCINAFGLLVIIFNLIIIIIFGKKFTEFTKKNKNRYDNEEDTMKMLEEGDLFEDLQKSSQASLLNLGMYLLMFVILLFFVFFLATINSNTLVKIEVNSIANNIEEWNNLYGANTYNQTVQHLRIFITLFCILSLFVCGYACFLFYLIFTVLGFFHIYQKIVQFIIMLFLQLGIIFLYLSICLQRYNKINLIDESYVSWLPLALLVCSIFIILLSGFLFISAGNQNFLWLVIACVGLAIFISVFFIFIFIAIISTSSLEKYSDNRCPILIDYFSNDYVKSIAKCKKYIQTSNNIFDLNCPKERIVTFWENDKGVELSNEEKEFKYGCIDISCCFKFYNIIFTFHNYIILLGFGIVLFGIILIGTTFFLINLIQRKFPTTTQEKNSLYFVYVFVGIITIGFIILLVYTKKPDYSTSFTNEFNPSEEDFKNADTYFNPLSIILKDEDLSKNIKKNDLTELANENIITEDYHHCLSKICIKLNYIADVYCLNFNIGVNEDLLNEYGYSYQYVDDKNKNRILVFGDNDKISQNIFSLIVINDDNINKDFCMLSTVNIELRFSGSSKTLDQNTVISNLIDDINQNKTQEVPYVNDYLTTYDENKLLYSVNMSKVEQDKIYKLYGKKYDFSISSDEDKKQNILGKIISVDENGEIIDASNAKVGMEYVNFKNCKGIDVVTGNNGDFIIENIPVLNNDVQNEIKLTVTLDNGDEGEDDNKHIIITGGIGMVNETNISNILMETNLRKNEELNQEEIEDKYSFSFNSVVIDSIKTTPINNVTIHVYKGDMYFPNSDFNFSKNDYSYINTEEFISSTTSNKNGKFEIENILSENVYTFLFEKEGYYFKDYLYQNLGKEKNNQKEVISFALTPILKSDENNIRIVLEWPNTPYDLNLFSYFKVSSTDRCEVFFGNRKCQNVELENINYNNGTQGSQVMNIKKLGKYIYTFVIKKFNLNDDSIKRNEIKVKGAELVAPDKVYSEYMRLNDTEEVKENNEISKIEQSGATVSLYFGNFKKEVYKININNGVTEEGDTQNNNEDNKEWIAFCLDGEKGINSLRTVNKITSNKVDYTYCEKIYEE